MKSLHFLVFTAVVIISTSICILVGYKTIAMIAVITGYSCGTAIAAWMTEDNDAGKEYIPIGARIGAGIIIGGIFALFGWFNDCNDWMYFSFVSSVLGAVVGCMYKSTSVTNITDTSDESA